MQRAPEVDAANSVMSLLRRICPSMSGSPVFLEKVSDLTGRLPVPLFVLRSDESTVRLTLREKSEMLSLESRGETPAGAYHLHVFDTFLEANAAATILESFGFLAHIERAEMPSGEGLVLARTGNVQGEATPGDVLFTGKGGAVSVSVIDNRKADDADPDLAAPAKIALSVCYSAPCFDLALERRSQPDFEARQRRGRLLASHVEASAGTSGAVRICQRQIESIPGAVVSSQPMSLEMVNDALSDLGVTAQADECRANQLLLQAEIKNIYARAVSNDDAAEQMATILMARGGI